MIEEWHALYSPQHTFQSSMKGGSKYLRTLNDKAERMLKALDGNTTEQYKNKQRERVYDGMERCGKLAELEADTILRIQAQMLLLRMRVCAARYCFCL